jgi:iron complex outermembrane receptor protein
MNSSLRSTLTALLLPGAAYAQDSTVARLPTVEVTVTRESARSPLELPYAISVTTPDSLRPGLRRLALDEILALIPGIAVANRNNPTQDPRITIRGFGARSAFGVRGVRVLRDGIPLTLPDGQTPVDYIDLESVESVEVIRGTASALYGNAGGGVVDLRSAPPPLASLGGRVRYVHGEDGLRRWHAGIGGTSEPWAYQASVTRTDNDGFRDYSRQRTTHAVARATLDRGATLWSAQLIGFDMPVAENPGALTAAEVAANPDSADFRSQPHRARKDVRQGQAALAFSRRGEWLDLSASVYGGIRDLYNPLPFAVIGVDRTSYGAAFQGSTRTATGRRQHRITFGVDVQRQNDDRVEHANCNSPATPPPPSGACGPTPSERGELTRSQIERVTSLGPYLRDEIELSPSLMLSLGVRGDRVMFDVADRFTDDGDDSGDEAMTQVSPMVGLVARIGVLTSVYATVSSAFETPTATEMGNRPDGSGGINSDLDPQTSLTYEVGTKGTWRNAVHYDAAVFLTDVRDELIPFESGVGGRRFFRNAGRTERRGAELGLQVERRALRLGASYSWSDFQFEDFTVGTTEYAGNRIPGIPEHQGQASLSWLGPSGFTATLEAIAASRIPVNDANSAYAPGYEIMNVRFAGAGTMVGGRRIAPVVGMQNVFDRSYIGSVSVNAALNRFFEPAPGRTLFVGTSLELGR